MTGNSSPPSDPAFKRRFVLINFTQEDENSDENQVREFEKLFNERIKHELPLVGNFAANYILENQQILLDGKKDWKEISEIILIEMYKEAGLKEPEWIKYFVQNTELKYSKEDIDLLFRNFLITKINDAYCKYYKSIADSRTIDGVNQSFNKRLTFCLEHNLIPFLNTNSKGEIIITSDIIQELKNHRISAISSLKEVSNIIYGFEYGQKKLGSNRNVRAAYGSITQLLEFLNIDDKNNDNGLLDNNNNDTIISKFSTSDRKSENEININSKTDDDKKKECYVIEENDATTINNSNSYIDQENIIQKNSASLDPENFQSETAMHENLNIKSKTNCREVPADVVEDILKIIRDEKGIIALGYALQLACQRSEIVKGYFKDEKKLTQRDSRTVQNLFVEINRHPNIEVVKKKPQIVVKWIEQEVLVNN